MNKVFKGIAFNCDPKVIEFKDFEVNESYTKIITLTNSSNSFNSFKLLPLKDNVIDFFEVTYKPPGRMSAGISC